MAIIHGKLVVELENQCPADKFYKIFKSAAHHMPNLCPETVTNINVHKGDWETPGSVKKWNYVVGGKNEVVYETIEAVDDENRAFTFRALDGSDVLKSYKNYTMSLQVLPKGNNSVAKWTIEYEKLNENVPEPIKYLEIPINFTKALHVNHQKA